MKRFVEQLTIVVIGMLITPVIRKKYRSIKKTIVTNLDDHWDRREAAKELEKELDLEDLFDGFSERLVSSERYKIAMENVRRTAEKFPLN